MKEQTEAAAGADEVQEAFVKLRAEELHYIECLAKNFARHLQSKSNPNVHLELLYEAFLKTLEGSRPWRASDSDFITHLINTMRSISSNWFKQQTRSAKYRAALPAGKNGDEISLFENMPSGSLCSEKILIQKEEETQIEQYKDEIIGEVLDQDEDAKFVFDGLWSEKKGSAIRYEMNKTQSEYDTIVKRLRRKIRNSHIGRQLEARFTRIVRRRS